MPTSSSTSFRNSSIRELITALGKLSRRFSPEDAAAKQDILQALQPLAIRSPAMLQRYHEILCFLRAYPDNREILRRAESELQNFADRVRPLVADDDWAQARLSNTGIAETVVEYSYDWDMALWLAKNFPGAVAIDWDAYNEMETDALASVLPFLATWTENDTLDDPDQATEDWVSLAKGQGRSDFLWLVTRMQDSSLPSDVQRHLYETLELPLRWRPGNAQVTRSRSRLPVRRVHYQRGPIKRLKGGLRAETVRPLPPLRPLPKRHANAIIDMTIGALLVRQRELYPVDHANPAEVFLADVGRGIQIAIIGTLPAFRLPLEADYAAFIIKNGLPIGYGVGAVLFDRVEIAINIFDTFRGGEAAYIFAQFLRLFHHHFGVTTFLLRRYQVGHENEEGLAAGAYWFYYKLGLRSFEPEIAQLAEEEFAKIRADRSYRSPRRTLRRLALSDLYMNLDASAGPYRELSLSRLGLAVTRYIAERHAGDKIAATRAATRRLSAALNVPDWRKWMADEQEAFRRLSLLFGLIPDLDQWSTADKKALAQIMRAKGQPGETDCARRLLKHRRLYEALWKIAEREEGSG